MSARRSHRSPTRFAVLAVLAVGASAGFAVSARSTQPVGVAGPANGHRLDAETPTSVAAAGVTTAPSSAALTVSSSSSPPPSPSPAPGPRPGPPPTNPRPANPWPAARPANPPAVPPAALAAATPPPVSARDAVVTGFAAGHGFTVHLLTMPGYRGPPAYASTDMSSCQVWVGPRTTRTLALDVVRHEYIHVLACREGTHFATPHFEHVADAGAALQGARHTFYGAFSRDDILEARRLLATGGPMVAQARPSSPA